MPSRKRTYNVRLVKATWSYSVQEIAELFGLHKNAVLRWFKEGLRANSDGRPFLVRGTELSRFLTARKTGRRCRCASDEFYCFRCRAPRTAYLGIADIVVESPTRLQIKALCAGCSTPVNKMQAVRDLPKIQQRFEIQQLTGEHLLERTDLGLNCDLGR